MWSLNTVQMNISMKQKDTDGEPTCCIQGGRKDWEFGVSRCELLYVRWMNKVVPYIAQGTIFSIL